MTKLLLQRKVYNTEPQRNIIGVLFIDSGEGFSFFCYTLEDEKRADGIKVKHETAIPAGSYNVTLSYSPKFKRITPEILQVPGFSGIRMHGGNYADDTSGCPLVGYNVDLKRSRIHTSAEKDLTRLLTDKVTISIEIQDRFLSSGGALTKTIS